MKPLLRLRVGWMMLVLSALLVACDSLAFRSLGVGPPDRCGDGHCDPDESMGSCPVDCGALVQESNVEPVIEMQGEVIALACNFDGECGPGEYHWNCEDCFCGDGVCRGETCCSCPDDCHFGDPTMPCLGNMQCDWACGEDWLNAPDDCNHCIIYEGSCLGDPDPVVCGDGWCDALGSGESCDNCPQDCGQAESCTNCGNGVCEPGEGWGYPICEEDCLTCGDGVCSDHPYNINLTENCATCPADCGECTTCGDGVCEPWLWESCSTCPDDCHLGNPLLPCCGNDMCQAGEDSTNCPCDCGGTGDCVPTVTTGSVCGNYVIEPGEECDSGSSCQGVYSNLSSPRDWYYCDDCFCRHPCDHDGVCERYGVVGGESCSICPDCDFGLVPGLPCCGNGDCREEHGETPATCHQDCPYEALSSLSWLPSDLLLPVGPFMSAPYSTETICPQGSDGCTSHADCGEGAYCNFAACDCYTCSDFPWACTSDAECDEIMPGSFCKADTCSCYLCPDDSVDNCHTDAECQEKLGNADAYCHLAFCDCKLPCDENSHGCITDEDCRYLLGNLAARCDAESCNCYVPCPEGSPCAGLTAGAPCKAGGLEGTCQNCECVVESPALSLCPPEAGCVTQYFPVYDCEHLGGGVFRWYGAEAVVDKDGRHLSVEYKDGPHTGGWQSNCPGIKQAEEEEEEKEKKDEKKDCVVGKPCN